MISEYAAVRDGGAGLIDLTSRGRMRVSGSEATMFLNGLITNDVKGLAVNRWMPAAFANVQGRLLGAVRVARTGDAFLIDTEQASYEAVVQSVARFTLAGDFHVSDMTPETAHLTIQGKQSAEFAEKVFETSLSELPRNGLTEIHWKNTPVTVLRATHTAEDGFDLVIESTRASELQEALINAGAQTVNEDAFEILRVEAGIARYGIDIDETNVVPETNLDDAVSYSKGCYVGQEIIVRIKHRGHVAKKLAGLKFGSESAVEAGATIRSEESADIGRVTSAVFSPKLKSTIGLGYVRHEHLAPGTKVLIDSGITGTIHDLPFVRGSWYQG
jgi:folate-binding protein YgfZ